MFSIEITEAARLRMNKLLDRTDALGIRLSVTSKGCGGHSYKLDFLDEDAPTDGIDLGNGRVLVIDPRSELWLIGIQIDYAENSLSGQFTFNNPAAQQLCGCGKSFTCS